MKLRSKALAGQVVSGNQLDHGFPIRFDEDGFVNATKEQAAWILADAQLGKLVDVVTPSRRK